MKQDHKKLNILLFNNLKQCKSCDQYEGNSENFVTCKSSACCKNKLNILTRDCPKEKWKSPKTILEEKAKHIKNLIYNVR